MGYLPATSSSDSVYDAYNVHTTMLVYATCNPDITYAECSDDRWRNSFIGKHEHGALWLNSGTGTRSLRKTLTYLLTSYLHVHVRLKLRSYDGIEGCIKKRILSITPILCSCMLYMLYLCNLCTCICALTTVGPNCTVLLTVWTIGYSAVRSLPLP